MSEEVKTTEETLYCECCGCVIDDDDYTEWNGQIICSDCLENHTTTCDAVGNASGMRMSMVTMTSPFAAIAIITATPDAAVVMLFCTRTMPIIWTVKRTAVTAMRMNVKKVI